MFLCVLSFGERDWAACLSGMGTLEVKRSIEEECEEEFYILVLNDLNQSRGKKSPQYQVDSHAHVT